MVFLDTDDPERARRLALIWDPEVETWLGQIDVRQGWHCADLGCGSLGVLEPLSRRSGEGGRVIGIEPRRPLLEAARQYVQRTRLDNVRLLDTPPERTTLPAESQHLAHGRFLLANGAPVAEIVAEMKRLVRAGGVVAMQEPDPAGWRCHPAHDAWTSLVDVVRRGFAAAGGDLEAGTRTFGLLRDAGLEDVRVRAASIALQGSHPHKRQLVELGESLRERILADGIASEMELDETLAECDRIASDPESVVVSFLVTQVWGRKPGRWRP